MARHLNIFAVDVERVAEIPDLYQMILQGQFMAAARGDAHGVIDHVDRLESWGFLKLPTDQKVLR